MARIANSDHPYLPLSCIRYISGYMPAEIRKLLYSTFRSPYPVRIYIRPTLAQKRAYELTFSSSEFDCFITHLWRKVSKSHRGGIVEAKLIVRWSSEGKVKLTCNAQDHFLDDLLLCLIWISLPVSLLLLTWLARCLSVEALRALLSSKNRGQDRSWHNVVIRVEPYSKPIRAIKTSHPGSIVARGGWN